MNTMKGMLLAVATCALFSSRADRPAQATEPSAVPLDEARADGAILGDWWTEGREGKIRFVHAEDGTYTGVLVWSKEDKKDVKNKDPRLRSRSLVGVALMWHLRAAGAEYVDGYVYNPRDGDTYRFKAEVTGKDSLKICGYLGIPLLGQCQAWTRAGG